MEPRFYLYIIGMNVGLKALHKFLTWLAPRTQCKLDDQLSNAIDYMLTLLEWAMGSIGCRDKKG